MGKMNSQLGKSVAHHMGYNVRQMVTKKTNDKIKQTVKPHTGMYGIYAGKNKVDEAKNIVDAVAKIDKIIAEKKAKKNK